MAGESKFTPGPWHHDHWERVRPVNGPQDGTADICHVYGGNSERERFNRLLIAAAPDLLAACQLVIDAANQAGSEEQFGELVSELAMGTIRAAISKATGEPINESEAVQ